MQPHHAPVRQRPPGTTIIAALCLLMALYLLPSLTLYTDPALRSSLSEDPRMMLRFLLPATLDVVLFLLAGVCVYLSRVEAVLCLGWILGLRLDALLSYLSQRMSSPVQPPQLMFFAHLVFVLVVLVFTMRLFARARVAPAWLLLIGLSLQQLLTLLMTMPDYLSVFPFYSGSALIGSLILYVAVWTAGYRPWWARLGFLLAALVMECFLPDWGRDYALSAPCWQGVAVAAIGFGLSFYPGTKRVQASDD